MKSLLISTLVLAAAAASAQNAPPTAGSSGGERGPRVSAEERFKQLDANADGKVTLAEYLAAPSPNGAPAQNKDERTARFKKMDANNDGSLSLDEYKAGRAAMRGTGGQRPEGQKTAN